jgi:sulfite reductase alpha subunit-like flavoprotein
LLFFGCRNEHKDFLCGEEWKSLEQSGHLQLVTAFSRDQVNVSDQQSLSILNLSSQDDKVYVQHKIVENGSLVWDLLSTKNACFYVAG